MIFDVEPSLVAGKLKECVATDTPVTGCLNAFEKIEGTICLCDTDLCNGIQKICPQITILVVSILLQLFL